jgi:hypothetical protein
MPMDPSGPPANARVARAMEALVPGAFVYVLGSSPAKMAYALLGLLGLAVLVYVVIPVLKALGASLSTRIEARLMPPNQEPPDDGSQKHQDDDLA